MSRALRPPPDGAVESLAHWPRERDLETLLGRDRFAALELAVLDAVRESRRTGEEVRVVVEWRCAAARVVDGEVKLVRRLKMGGG